LRVFRVGHAFKKAVGGLENGEGGLRAIDEGGEAFAVAFAGFAEEDGTDGASGAESFFHEADTFDADGARFGGKAATQRHAKFLEPAIVAAGEESRRIRGTRVAGGFYGGSHHRERNKF
jgi:hypothetical protein